MKWTNLYKQSNKFIISSFVLGFAAGLVGTNYGTTTQPGDDFVFVDYQPYKNSTTAGQYNNADDKITIFYEPGDNIYESLVHELKHADNARQFPYKLNTNANELSAYTATELYNTGTIQRVEHAYSQLYSILDTLPNAAFTPPIESMARERLSHNKDYVRGNERLRESMVNDTWLQLRAEREQLIDSIARRFDGAVRDSMVREIETKYDEQSIATKHHVAVGKTVENLYNEARRTDQNVFNRDFDYSLPNLNQQIADEIILKAMEHYQNVRDSYRKVRIVRAIQTQFHPLDDADLEKLFTYKINGKHQSLFKMASPNVKAQVRNMANAGNLLFMARAAFSRE